MKVRPKKSLGQHFLMDQSIAKAIVDALPRCNASTLEIGPGTGVLTQYMVAEREARDLKLIEIDRDSVAFLKEKYPEMESRIIEGDFLAMDLNATFSHQLAIIGNFPYNISSQIFFKVLDYYNKVDVVVCMLQKEVADRLAAPPGNKTYGILSVLLQAFYKIEYLFNVPPSVFNPPPKVMSGVIRLIRNERTSLSCDEKLFRLVVKQGFNTRRKTLRNALKNLNLATEISALPLLDKRAEQLSVEDFIHLTTLIQQHRATHG